MRMTDFFSLSMGAESANKKSVAMVFHGPRGGFSTIRCIVNEVQSLLFVLELDLFTSGGGKSLCGVALVIDGRLLTRLDVIAKN
jgi:hypothetical protein